MYKTAVKHFKTKDPVLFSLIDLTEPFELEVHPDPFLRLTRSIVGQQLSVKAASTIFARFEKLFKNGKITPQALIKLSDEQLRSVGLSRQKASYLKDLAQKVIDKTVELDKFGELESEVII